MNFETRELTPRIRTAIKANKEELMKGGLSEEIRELLEQSGVLLFRELNMTDEEQSAFSKTLGEVIPQGPGGIFKITLDPKLNPVADYLHATYYWHIDGAQDDVLTRASLLSARVLSKVGPDRIRQHLCRLWRPARGQEAHGRFAAGGALAGIHPAGDAPQSDRSPVGPLARTSGKGPSHGAWTHRSGRKSLVLGLTAGRIDGMDTKGGRAIIDEMQAWATQPQFVYRHHWTVGDMIIWDNTGVMHRVEKYPEDSGRLLAALHSSVKRRWSARRGARPCQKRGNRNLCRT